MKTSSFFLYQGPGRVCVARYAPRSTPAGYKMFKALAPTKEMLKMTNEHEYRDLYHHKILKPLNPQETWDKLITLGQGHEPVLLCWEKLKKDDEWCHRRMIAAWFKVHLGHDVPELDTSATSRCNKTVDMSF